MFNNMLGQEFKEEKGSLSQGSKKEGKIIYFTYLVEIKRNNKMKRIITNGLIIK